MTHNIELKFACFFLGSNPDLKKYHWRIWSSLCYPVNEGGLGLRSLESTQRPLDAACMPSDSVIWRIMATGFGILQEHTKLTSSGDLIWCPSTPEKFTLTSAYEEICPHACSLFSVKFICRTGFPLKVSIFLWKLFNSCCGFLIDLTRFGIHLPSIYPLCKQAEATQDHCLLLCPFSSQIWRSFQIIFEAPPLQSTIHTQCHLWWLSMSSSSLLGTIGLMIPSLILLAVVEELQ